MKKVVLTFDDGPSDMFKLRLNYLIKNNCKAIFFCTGENLEKKKYEDILIKAIKKGIIIGNHTYSHPNLSFTGYSKIKEEILKTDKIIDYIYSKAKIKRKIKLIRFPYFCSGGINFFRIQRLLKKLGYTNPYFTKRFFPRVLAVDGTHHFIHRIIRNKYEVYCNIDTKDWDLKNNLDNLIPLLDKVENKDIICFHDHEDNFELDKKIIEYLKSRNFLFTI